MGRLKYDIRSMAKDGEVVGQLTLDSDNQSSVNPWALHGDSDEIKLLRHLLPTMSGLYGHILGVSATPIDLDYAINSYKGALFRFELAGGTELLSNYNSVNPSTIT